MNYIYLLIFSVLAFLSGSIPFGYFVAKSRGVDIKNTGSGNIGATNVFRSVGKLYGILVLLLDMIKGILPVFIYMYVINNTIYPGIVALFAILGHIFTPWLGFKGGKGVATTVGVFLMLSPISMLISLVVWLLIFLTTKYVSLASILLSITLPLTYFLLHRSNIDFSILALALLLTVIIFLTHTGNIKRLLKGKERKTRL